MASYAAADRIGHALPQPTPELLQGFDTATQITALAHWFRHQPSPASPLAARAFAMPCASPLARHWVHRRLAGSPGCCP